MNVKLHFWPNLLFIFVYLSGNTRATVYKFLIDNPNIFEDCENEQGYLGVNDIVDLSSLRVEFFDEGVYMQGPATMLWDVDPNDLIEFHADIFKYERGSWQPTVFTIIEKDFCKSLFNGNSLWYQSWGRFINREDYACINHKGHTFHHTPFTLETLVDLQGEHISGRYKVVVKMQSYNFITGRQPNAVCYEIVGEVIRV